MNYIDTLNTYLEQRFLPILTSTTYPAGTALQAPTAHIKTLLHGLSYNQFQNLLTYLREEGHLLRADAATLTFCPHYVRSICGSIAYPPLPVAGSSGVQCPR